MAVLGSGRKVLWPLTDGLCDRGLGDDFDDEHQ